MNNETLKRYYYKLLLIRQFENKAIELASKNLIRGTLHCCIGQEIIPVILSDFIDIEKDHVTGTHRSHGHYLALFGDPKSLFYEIMKGKGGTQHLHRDNFYTNGITGGMIPVATGLALSEKLNQSGNIVVAFLGDGAMNEGYVTESFNFASVMGLPILYVLEDNKYAMSTNCTYASSGDFIKRLDALNIRTYKTITTNIKTTFNVIKESVSYVSNNQKPAFVHFITYRHCGHSKTDKCEYRRKEEEQFWIDNDVIGQLEKIIGNSECQQIKAKVDNEIETALEQAIAMEGVRPVEIY
jgi:TPP-dependent pyruvate/acetoin dehydrogenase alpha subunit